MEAGVVVAAVVVVAAEVAVEAEPRRADRFGLGWRPALAVEMHRLLDRIDVLEFIVDDWFDASRAQRATLQAWCRLRPCHLHGVGLGLASTEAVDPRLLERFASVVKEVRPECWSEHLCFVRAGGVEIGHLTAPPRSAASVAGALRNLAAAVAAIGSQPLLENVATLIHPPGSTLDEAAWLTAILRGGGAGMILDLHNWYANAVNFGFDPVAALAQLPLERVRAVHLSGGRWIGRLLDDHLHDPPDAVYLLLEELAARCPQPLDVIIERDGCFPAVAVLCEQLDRARASVARGRSLARTHELTRI
jgi:uncharacterized protein (UPF0276 family)